MHIDFFRAADQSELRSWFSSQEAVTQWAGPGVAWPLTAGFMRTLLDSDEQQPARLLTFATRRDGRLAAVAQLSFDWENHLACLCRVAVNPALRGKGLAGELLNVMIHTAFKDPAIERLELVVYPQNRAAVRTYEKLGFVREGVRRACVAVGEARWDSAFYGLLRAEFTARSAA
ncbi:GNAT family N-acetyltransferase [Erwinia sp. ErVv1]|uniref:GNAT family N-acetyltransferase n=1 Tax=Erwinia sp. ErVv1 TaxID=1603299 RepID=UPI000833EE6E|nr:GNAT family protein [Erwinia sp. ErVv1]